MTKIVNIPDVSLSAVEDIGNIVFKAFRPELSGALNVTLFNFCHVLRTVLYVGATGMLKNRIESHIEGKATKFTKRYSVNELLYFERFDLYSDAFIREKQIKNWKRAWKWNLIKSQNPELKNLYLELKYLD